MPAVKRRDFLKTTAVGGMGVAATGFLNSAPARSNGTVNPGINDTLVVNCTDSTMVTGDYDSNYTTQFSRLDSARIKANMDELAKALASKSTASEAWATIFRKPSAKQWSAVTVAVKVNCINASMYVKPTIIGKVCEELIALGVQASNICLFDGGNATDQATQYNSYIGGVIPAGVAALNRSNSQQVRSTRDIMVNCAINKGHSNGNAGDIALCMKNHVGTYKFSCPSSLDETIGWSQTAMAGNPPMQQLCIVDSLFAACNGPGDAASHQPNCISMSTHPAAIDVLVNRKIRTDIMHCSENTSAMDYFLSAFGLSRAGLVWQEVTPAGNTPKTATPVISPNGGSFSGSQQVTISCSTAGATIRYTTNNATPTESSTAYSVPIAVTATTTIKAIAFAGGHDPSSMATAVFAAVTMRPADNPADTTAGLAYSYYETSGALSSVNDIASQSVTASGTAATIGLGTAQRSENYAFKFEGFVEVPADGIYTFYTSSDDGSALYIGDTKVVDNNGNHAETEESGTIGLMAGKHAITVLFTQGTGGAALSASIAGGSLTKQAIGASRLFHVSGATRTAGADSIPGVGILNARVTGKNGIDVVVNRSGRHTCTIVTVRGTTVASRSGSGYSKFRFTGRLAPGSYIVRMTGEGGYSARRVVNIMR